MPRPLRKCPDGLAHHVLNRGNKRARVFLQPEDYEGFIHAMSAAAEATAMRILTYCLMPNHFHLVLWPIHGSDLSAYMQKLMNAHIRDLLRRHEASGTGHIYQGRFKNLPIQTDRHLLAVCRYVEANPFRAHLVDRAEQWPWSRLQRTTTANGQDFLAPWPVVRPSDWLARVNRQDGQSLLARIRRSVNRGTPLRLSKDKDHKNC
jgi:putative transposase